MSRIVNEKTSLKVISTIENQIDAVQQRKYVRSVDIRDNFIDLNIRIDSTKPLRCSMSAMEPRSK